MEIIAARWSCRHHSRLNYEDAHLDRTDSFTSSRWRIPDLTSLPSTLTVPFTGNTDIRPTILAAVALTARLISTRPEIFTLADWRAWCDLTLTTLPVERLSIQLRATESQT